MADNVVDIITRLSLQSDTKGGEQQLAVIEENIKAVDQNAASIARLEAVRDKTDKANLTRINQINQAIDNRKKKIEQETVAITKEIQVNEKLRTSLAKQGIAMAQAGDRLDKFQKSSNSATLALTNLGRVAQDAPFGFLGIANNLNPLLESFQRLRQESGSNVQALKALGSSMIGAGGLGLAISVISSLLVVFGDKLFNTAKAADAASESYKEFLKTISSNVQNTQKAIDGQINRLNVLKGVIESTTASEKQRAGAIAEIQKQFPNLTKEQILRGEIFKTLEKEIRAKEISNLASETAVNLQERERDIKNQIAKEEIRVNKELADIERTKQKAIEATGSFNPQTVKKAQDNAKKNLVNLNKELSDTQKLINKANRQAVVSALDAGTEVTGEPEKPTKEKKDRVKDAVKLRIGVPTDVEMESISQDIKQLERLKDMVEDILGNDVQAPFAEGLIGGGKETAESRRANARLEINRDNNKKIKEDDEKAKAEKEKNLNSIRNSYESFRDSIVEIIQSIYDRQIQLLDKEVEIRRERVSQAVLLAERGNTEILKQEQERLDAAQKKREEIAKKQLQINALLQASSAAIAATQAIQVVTNAGATGDPYSTAARIAAAVAALAAGFAFVSNLVNAFKVDSFKDGVVDYQGKGTETSDSNTVRISKGESVVTAKATKQYKPILEMMNKGIPLPIAMAYPSQSKNDNKSLEKRLDMVIDELRHSGLNVSTQVTNGHIATIVETHRKTEQRRWS